ncbi:hypothetical protein LL998_21770 [Burkholderia ambifaria]|uniref:hypothetical protein n=1 Tax=Burkholderia ambifaria TaxID=152480 RepID=UPI001E5F63AE|nr:hypothetical protein [Burkholderia ambifaria]UEP38574.1 hypothetical protein LL998_21770 [Burkholderia ambifaria]
MDIPKTEDPAEFEKMVRDAYALKWVSPNLQLNGRRGQAQAGVDVFGEDDLGRSVGIQCKLYSQGLKLSMVKEEIDNAAKFEPPIECLYIASTFPADAKLQREVRLLSRERVNTKLFPVGLIFWSDIVSGLALNPKIFRNYFPQINLEKNPDIDLYRLDLCLDLGFYGAYTRAFLELLFGEFGQMANEDVRQFEVVLEVIENAASQLLPTRQATAIVNLVQVNQAALFGGTKAELDWRRIEDDSKMIEQRVKASGSYLSGGKEPLALSIGIQLGGMNHHFDNLEEVHLDKIRELILKFLPAESKDRIEEHVLKLRTRDKVNWGSSLLTFVSRELRQLPPDSM